MSAGNGLLRQYFPKWTALSNYSQADLDLVAGRLNARPRKTLEYETPAAMLAAIVASTPLTHRAKWGCHSHDAVPERPDDTAIYVHPGDLWALGDHRLLCGDATNAQDVARLLAGARPTLLVTDPPYGVSLDMGGATGQGSTASDPPNPRTFGPRVTGPRASRVTRVRLVGRLRPRVIARGRVRLALDLPSHRGGQGTRSDRLRAAPADRLGKDGPGHQPLRVQLADGTVLVRREKGRTAHWQGDGSQTTLWTLASPKMTHGGSTESKFDHPTQKPIEAMARPIRNHRGDVYDPFLGSGTTLIAAELLGRVCHAMELEPSYVQVAIERWQANSALASWPRRYSRSD